MFRTDRMGLFMVDILNGVFLVTMKMFEGLFVG